MDANFRSAKDNVASAYSLQFIHSFIHLFNQYSAFPLHILQKKQLTKHDGKPKDGKKKKLSFKTMYIFQDSRNDMYSNKGDLSLTFNSTCSV